MKRIVLLTLVALGGLALAVGITTAATKLTSQSVGLESEPLTAGDDLAPRRAPVPRTQTTPTRTTEAPPRTTTPTTPAPTITTPRAPEAEDEDSGRGRGRSRGRGRGGEDDD